MVLYRKRIFVKILKAGMLISVFGLAACSVFGVMEILTPEEPLTKKEIRRYTNDGISLARKGHLDKAKKMLERVLRNDPDKAKVKIILGRIYVKQRKNKDAIRILEQVHSPSKNNPDYFQLLGRAYFQNGNLERADKEYQKALALNSRHAATINFQGDILKARGDIKGAAKSYRRALKINSRLGAAHYNMGLFFEERKQYIQALSEFQVAISSGEKSADVYNHLVELVKRIYRSKKGVGVINWIAASEALEYVISSDSGSAEIHYLLGIAHLENSFYRKAIGSLEKAIDEDDDQAYFHYNLGIAYEASGMTDKAIESYKEAVELDKKNVEARSHMAALFFKRKEYDRSEKLDQEILQMNPNNSEAKKRLVKLRKLR